MRWAYRMNRKNGRRRVASLARKREGGAALVEMAIVLPLLLMLFMGIADFGLAIADYNSLRQGTREGVRRVVVADVGSDSSCAIGGATPSTETLSKDTASLVCLTKARTGLDTASTLVAVKFDSSYAEGDALILCTQYTLSSVTGFFGYLLDSRIVHAQVDMRIEKDTLDIEAFQEAGGDGWGWCG